MTNIDYLTEDEVIPNQLWCCMSFLSPEGVRNCKIRGIKVRGVFGSESEANQHAKDLQTIDPDFHVFVGEVGKWLPMDPDPNSVSTQEYREAELNKLMKSYKEQQVKAKAQENERRNELLEDAITNGAKKGKVGKSGKHDGSDIKQRLKQQLLDKQQATLSSNTSSTGSTGSTTKNGTTVSITELEEEKEVLLPEEKAQVEGLQSEEKKLQENKSNISKIDENISKVRDLYNTLMQKQQEKQQENK